MDPHDFHAQQTAFVRRHQELCRAHARMLAVNGALPVDMLLGWDCVLLESDGDGGFDGLQLELGNVEGVGFSAVAVMGSDAGEGNRTQRDGGAVAQSVGGGGTEDAGEDKGRQGGDKEGQSEGSVSAHAGGGMRTEPSKEVSQGGKERGSAR
ncbi:uncharacterized protein AB675_6600 [Cyphellophora attinorum]|uniref:Uncharacterized protein n=1 Tax=Cyphellophora attinorum TaxID=1664694 RepID=A0A0N0NQK9_9EURO|nr:uncharacterized protein AB675_6600 [Phialophora attinorum]KPI44028.1 hypothetical protein AB675_6600 [Phialophora attinorum]